MRFLVAFLIALAPVAARADEFKQRDEARHAIADAINANDAKTVAKYIGSELATSDLWGSIHRVAASSHDQETLVITTLLPFIDGHYRTRDDRAHRAAAGFSAGGLDAMVFTARHPDLFIAAGSFSGFDDPIDPVGVPVIQQFADFDDQLCGATISWLDLWGDPALHPMGWEGHDPTNLASNLADTSLFIASGNGTECAGDPVHGDLASRATTTDRQLRRCARRTIPDHRLQSFTPTIGSAHRLFIGSSNWQKLAADQGMNVRSSTCGLAVAQLVRGVTSGTPFA